MCGTAGARRFPVRRAGFAERILFVNRGRERSGTVVEESHLQGDRSSRRCRPGVFQVLQLAGAAGGLLTLLGGGDVIVVMATKLDVMDIYVFFAKFRGFVILVNA